MSQKSYRINILEHKKYKATTQREVHEVLA